MAATRPIRAGPAVPGVALQFVMNFEEGGENSVLHGDAASEAFLSDVLGAQPWRGQRHMNIESMFEYGSRAGFWRLWRLFTARNLPVTVYGVATALARNPEIVAAMREAGWEIASHGLKWIDYKDFSRDDEAAHMREAIRLHTEATGERPFGWYTGRSSANTLPLVLADGGFLYSSDSYADDLPYWVRGGDGPPHLIIPYTLDANDMRFINPQGFENGDAFFAYLRDSFDVLYAEGERAPKMMSIGLHCRLAGRPGRAAGLIRFLDYIAGFEKVWVATRLDIAHHWYREHHALGAHRLDDRVRFSVDPISLETLNSADRTTFLAAIGEVMELAPWVADEAFAKRPFANIAALYQAMTDAVRNAGDARQRALINGHPDLAGKAAREGALTAEFDRGAGCGRIGSPDGR